MRGQPPVEPVAERRLVLASEFIPRVGILFLAIVAKRQPTLPRPFYFNTRSTFGLGLSPKKGSRNASQADNREGRPQLG